MSSRHETGWDRVYHLYSPESLPWELGKPRNVLVKLVESGEIKPCRALDLCCGLGTNPIYLGKKGFSVTTLDISDEAIRQAKDKVHDAEVDINLLVGSFLSLPFKDKTFGFAFDFGCFHHVKTRNRAAFIQGVHSVLKPKAKYLMVCFSERNGSAWNHFRKNQIAALFKGFFKIEWIRHVSSVEGDNVTRYFYEVLMEKL